MLLIKCICNKVKMSSEDDNDEIWVLNISQEDHWFNLVGHLYAKFPNNVFHEVPEIDLKIDWYNTSKLFVIRAPRKRQEEILDYIRQMKDVALLDTVLKLQTKHDDDDTVYGLFDVTDCRHVMDVLDDMNDIDVYEMDDCDIPLGCLSCGGESYMLCIRASSKHRLDEVDKKIFKIDKSNGLVFEM